MIPLLSDDACPVADDLLGTLYRSHKDGLGTLVESVPPQVRAMLALYCYRRAHLQDLGLAIAGTCEQYDLVEVGAKAGEVLYHRAREPREAPPLSFYAGRRTVTLATVAPEPLTPLDDEPEPEAELACATA
ncbi:MAG TPA: hypothetical protein VNQ99_10265 [Xanthobacteraceae bacterium]|nr:hypothetical protein [Xanthobacteraceae bacterium]